MRRECGGLAVFIMMMMMMKLFINLLVLWGKKIISKTKEQREKQQTSPYLYGVKNENDRHTARDQEIINLSCIRW